MDNRAELIGRLGSDPDLRKTSNGDDVVNLSVATSESWKDRNTGERKEKTEWHRVVWWGKNLNNFCQYLKKGTLVQVIGKIETRKWTDQSGVEKYTTEIVVKGMRGGRVQILADGVKNNTNQQEQNNAPVDDYEDEIPF